MGVVIKRWVWLECIGVISGCCCKEAYMYPYPYSTVLQLFFAAVSLLLCSFLKCFFIFVYVILCNIANVAQRTFEIIQKSRSHQHGNIIILTSTSTTSPATSTYVVPSDVLQKLRADFVYNNGVIEISLLHVCTGETIQNNGAIFTLHNVCVNCTIIAMLYTLDWKSSVEHDGGV